MGADGTIAAVYSNGDVISARLNQASVAANLDDPGQWRTEIVHTTYEGGTYASGNVTGKDSGKVDQIGTSAVFDGGTGLGVGGNGMEGMLLHIQMASVPNPEGLLYDGNNNFLTAANSGPAEFGSAGMGSRGSISSGALESSNVDLAGEFTSMVITQRGLEAASKVIRTQSEILQAIIPHSLYSDRR